MTALRAIEKCPLCGSTEFKYHLSAKDPDGIYPEPFTLVRCALCGLVFLQKIPSQDGLYGDGYYRSVHPLMGGLFDLALSTFMSDRVKLIKRFIEGPGTILDVGCGDGSFLAGMKKAGWKSYGIDASKSAVAYAGRKGVSILGENFIETPIPDASVDAVTYWYSFEHILDPLAYLEKTNRILKKGGIVLIAVQNIASMQASYTGAKWFHLDLPRHTLHFSPETLALALAKSGFELAGMEHRSLQMNSYGWYQSILNLVDVQPNFVYNLMKRGCINKRKAVLSFIINLAVSPLALPLALVLAKVEELRKRGGIITAVAKKHL